MCNVCCVERRLWHGWINLWCRLTTIYSWCHDSSAENFGFRNCSHCITVPREPKCTVYAALSTVQSIFCVLVNFVLYRIFLITHVWFLTFLLQAGWLYNICTVLHDKPTVICSSLEMTAIYVAAVLGSYIHTACGTLCWLYIFWLQRNILLTLVVRHLYDSSNGHHDYEDCQSFK